MQGKSAPAYRDDPGPEPETEPPHRAARSLGRACSGPCSGGASRRCPGRLPGEPTHPQFPPPLLSRGANAEWNDWRWQLRNRIRDTDALARIINLCGRGTGRHRAAPRPPAGRHHALLSEPARSRTTRPAAAPHGRAGARRVPAHPGRGRRPARRGRPFAGARPRAPLPRPGPVPGHRLLLDLLPLLHPFAHGRQQRRVPLRPRGMAAGARLHRGHAGGSATCCSPAATR